MTHALLHMSSTCVAAGAAVTATATAATLFAAGRHRLFCAFSSSRSVSTSSSSTRLDSFTRTKIRAVRTSGARTASTSTTSSSTPHLSHHHHHYLQHHQHHHPNNHLLRLPTQSRRSMSSTPRLRSLNIDNINPHVKAAKYAVRGEIAVRAEKYRSQLADSDKKEQSDLPFESVISANIGNPQQLDQKPITFFRQVLSLVENPRLLDKPQVLIDQLGYQQDTIDRAKWLLSECHSVGAYSQSQGVPGIRKSVANFIQRRDGHPSDPASIYLTAGASSGVNTLMHVICASEKTGVLVPIPQYPLYTATLTLLNAHCVPYELDESKGWGTDLDTIKASLKKAQDEGIDVRAIVIINPGNPTGASLSATEIESVVEFASENKLVILADEVYQTNIFEGSFTSFKKALRDLQIKEPSKHDTVELASLHSVSKGMVGECGQRGGYMELIGFDPKVVEQIYKFVSIGLCPPVAGQCIVECMVNPPTSDMQSYSLYREEYDTIFNGLRDRAMALYEAFQSMEGVSCNKPTGSMYLFPSIELPKKAADAAKEEDREVDDFYVSKMLDATGVCMVAGGGFGQKRGTYHFRTTFLPPGTEWVDRLKKFHGGFVDKYR